MHLSRIIVQNFRQFGAGDARLEVQFNDGVTALVGRNDSGKSALIDAIRYALLTRDQSYIRVQPEDFHIDTSGKQASEILIRCQLINLDPDEKAAFVEYLSYEDGDVSLYVNWSAKRQTEAPSNRRPVKVFVRSGVNGNGPAFESNVRELLSATYLRPLRDAARELSSGRGSRLSQILSNVPNITEGESFEEMHPPPDPDAVGELSLLGLTDYLRHNVRSHAGITGAESAINDQYLSSLLLPGDGLAGRIDLTEGGNDATRLRRILERLELALIDAETSFSRGTYGLGSNNILFIACELLLLGREPDGLPLLLIEEPEAHLHPQRQLRLMDFLCRASDRSSTNSGRAVQVILSTHSPNLASTIPIQNLILLEDGKAHSLAEGETKLQASDYRFLERFLDVTKANLFFAHGVLIVEGVAEAILLPTIARLLGIDLTEHGVSIVDVGGTGLRRFSRIFQRAKPEAPIINIPVACLTDMDVMPNCAPEILGLVSNDDDEKWTSTTRKWRAIKELGPVQLKKMRSDLCRFDEQNVRTFVSDHWTLEYDLAFCGLAEEVHLAAFLAKDDSNIAGRVRNVEDVVDAARKAFADLESTHKEDHEALCSTIYKIFHSRRASKAIAAQYLAERLINEASASEFDREDFKGRLPKYIIEAISHATGVDIDTSTLHTQGEIEVTDQAPIPPITNEDIEWVCGSMGLREFDDARRKFLLERTSCDVSACPGSGKTTLIAAKLAILARKWPHQRKGVCVLSHTNAAREEVQRRLQGTDFGRQLLSYPHFIDTIHGFVNRFLAVPWLHSNGFPVTTIDDGLAVEYRLRSLSRTERNTVCTFLEKKRTNFSKVRVGDRDLSVKLTDKSFPCRKDTASYRIAVKAVLASIDAGYFCHDEMFVWAKALLQDCPEMGEWMTRRFPIVLIDEMQDTSSTQYDILNAVFPREHPDFVLQRVGDPNQAIFGIHDANDPSKGDFPDDRCIDIPNSFRFGPSIATLASSFAVRPVGEQGLLGIGPRKVQGVTGCAKNAAFIFEDAEAHRVLDAYGEYVLDCFDDATLARGIVSAVGAVHREYPDVNARHKKFPQTVPHYWPSYVKDRGRPDYHPDRFVDYVRGARELVREARDLAPGLEMLASGICRVPLRRRADLTALRKSKHRIIVDALADDAEACSAYARLLHEFLISPVSLSETYWRYLTPQIELIASKLVDSSKRSNLWSEFLNWNEDCASTLAPGRDSKQQQAGANLFRANNSDGRTVDIRVGSIHSVKGQTHLATLLLSTYWHAQLAKQMLPWLTGTKTNGNGAGVRDLVRLRQTYVALTRPSHLLCMSIPSSAFSNDKRENEINRIRETGWHVVVLEDVL